MLLINKNKIAGSLFVLDDWVIVQEGIEIAEGQQIVLCFCFCKGDEFFYDFVAIWTVLIQIEKQDYFNSFFSPQEFSNIFAY